METKRPTTTLLNKFTDLFRKSGSEGTDSALSTRSDSTPVSEDSLKQLLKNKRRNDAMRTYELNSLRTIIRSGRNFKTQELADTALAATQTRHSGMGSLERTSILNKIDGAQAHLEQWWGSGSGHAALAPKAESPAHTDAQPTPQDDDDLDLDFTGMQALAAEDAGVRYQASGPVPFTDDAQALTPVDHALRDAALLYAEGEFATAESTLTNLLAHASLEDEAVDLLTFALFDVYRCSGQQERFDALALEYASRFGRSPAEWFGFTDNGMSGASPDQAALTQDSAQQLFWKCPPILDDQALAQCAAHHAASSHVCSINWLPLQHMDAACAPAFAKQLAAWCENPADLHWLGIDCLMAALQMCRVSGTPPENEAWWLIQLDMLCLLQQPEAFEELAMEYCVAFEVSPPNWKPVACKLVVADAVPDALEFMATVPSQSFPAEQTGAPVYATCPLEGMILGENAKALRELRKASDSASQITVSCARLGRIDINAAGRLFSWAQECESRGCAVQFTFLPRLVQVYFQMLGMDKLASLSAGSH